MNTKVRGKLYDVILKFIMKRLEVHDLVYMLDTKLGDNLEDSEEQIVVTRPDGTIRYYDITETSVNRLYK